MSLNMQGHIDDVFTSFEVTQRTQPGSYVDGKWVTGSLIDTTFRANVQPATDRQIQTLQMGGRRVVDVRNVWINQTISLSIAPTDKWLIDGLEFETVSFDNRPSRTYAKVTVSQVV